MLSGIFSPLFFLPLFYLAPTLLVSVCVCGDKQAVKQHPPSYRPSMSASSLWSLSRSPTATFRQAYVDPYLYELRPFPLPSVLTVLAVLASAGRAAGGVGRGAGEGGRWAWGRARENWRTVGKGAAWWTVVVLSEVYLGLGAFCFSLSVVAWIYVYGLGERGEGDVSAYSIFRGGRKMMGEIDPGELVRQYVGAGFMGGVMGGFVGFGGVGEEKGKGGEDHRPRRAAAAAKGPKKKKKTTKAELEKRRIRQAEKRRERRDMAQGIERDE